MAFQNTLRYDTMEWTVLNFKRCKVGESIPGPLMNMGTIKWYFDLYPMLTVHDYDFCVKVKGKTENKNHDFRIQIWFVLIVQNGNFWNVGLVDRQAAGDDLHFTCHLRTFDKLSNYVFDNVKLRISVQFREIRSVPIFQHIAIGNERKMHSIRNETYPKSLFENVLNDSVSVKQDMGVKKLKKVYVTEKVPPNLKRSLEFPCNFRPSRELNKNVPNGQSDVEALPSSSKSIIGHFDAVPNEMNRKQSKKQCSFDEARSGSIGVLETETAKDKENMEPNQLSESDMLSSDLLGSLEKQQFCNAVITTKEENFKVHKLILSLRSSTFAKIFSPDINKKLEHIHISDVCGPAMKEIIHYIYGGKLKSSLSAKAYMEIYVAAESYCLPGLQIKCRQFLMVLLEASNVSEVSLLAHNHKDQELLAAAEKFMTSNTVRVLTSSRLMTMIQKDPTVAAEIARKLKLP